MHKEKILITGGTGYIGSHTAVLLIQQGYNVLLADNFSNSEPATLRRIEKITGQKPPFLEIDLCDRNAVSQLFTENPDVQGIIHFAAFKSVGESVRKPLKYYSNNLNCLLSLLHEMPSGIQSFIFSSSCTVYGQPEGLPVTEESPVQRPYSPYGNTKKICEELLEEFLNDGGQAPVISLRYFNPIGAHPGGQLGELPPGIPDNLIPYITQAAIGKRDQVTIFGNDFPTRDGTCIRDYIDVNDLAESHLMALERNLKKEHKEPFEVFNLGTGSGYSVQEVIHTFEKVNNIAVPHQTGARRPGDVAAIWADPAKANKLLKWKAHRGLAEMLRTAWEWEKNLMQEKQHE